MGSVVRREHVRADLVDASVCSSSSIADQRNEFPRTGSARSKRDTFREVLRTVLVRIAW